MSVIHHNVYIQEKPEKITKLLQHLKDGMLGLQIKHLLY